MEPQKLPNATTSMILAISALVGCCCTSGILGVIIAGIALYLINKDEKLYLANPEKYDNYSQLKTAKTISIIALVISIIYVIYLIYLVASGGFTEQMDQYRELIEQMQNQ